MAGNMSLAMSSKSHPAAPLTSLYSFAGSDGSQPRCVLVQGRDGNFYGTTVDGGQYGVGTIFKITPSGTLTILHTFVGADGGPTLCRVSARQRRQLLWDNLQWRGK